MNKPFQRFAEKEQIADDALCKAVADAESGLVAANLGGGVIKQRVARKQSGKSGGFRTIILYRAQARAVFVHGFAKNAKSTLSREELRAFKLLAKTVLAYSDAEMQTALGNGTFQEVTCDEQNI